jgi:hypothetical protein
VKGRLAAFAAALAGSAILGVAAGLIWAAVAPRALLQEVGHGEAQLVNAESTAYILADVWFCLIAAIGGVVTGIAGYRFLVRRAGWTAAAGLVLGTVAASLLMLWTGENIAGPGRQERAGVLARAHLPDHGGGRVRGAPSGVPRRPTLRRLGG